MDSCSAGNLVSPATPNYPGLDGILVLPANKLNDPAFWLYLQMTASLSHAVADEGVDNLDELSEKAPQKGNAAKRRALVFVVSGYHYDSFNEQKAKSKEKQRALTIFSQYVMPIFQYRVVTETPVSFTSA